MPALLRSLGRAIARALNGNVAIRAGKNARNAVIDRAFRCRGLAGGRRLAAELARRGGRQVTFTVAYNSPWVLDLLTLAWSRHQPELPLVVIDNSSNRSARSAHEELCRSRGILWLPLPWNPEWHPNRSHGIALNWTWFNVVRHADLEVVGFLDHDCIPVAGCDLGRRLEQCDAYGLRHLSATRPGAWNLWPGYCYLRPAAAARCAIDFKHRIEHGLDTGGGNWRGFYRRLDPSRVGAAACRQVRPDLGDGAEAAACPLIDEAFLHLEGASYRDAFRDDTLRRRIAEAVLERPFVCHPVPPPGTAGR